MPFSNLRIRSLVIVVTLVLTLFWSVLSYAAGLYVSVSSSGISASSADGSAKLMLRVGGPDGFRDEVSADGWSINWSVSGAADGVYRYDVYLRPANEDEGEGERATGSFEINGGRMITERDDPVSLFIKRQNALLNGVAIAAGEILNILVPVSHAQNLTASSSAPAITFTDTSIAGPAAKIVTDRLSNTRFSFEIQGAKDTNEVIDIDTDTSGDQSLTINTVGDIGLANNTVFIDKSLNRVGIGTAVPWKSLHIASAEPTLRLEDVGFVTYEINSSPAAAIFDIKDNTNNNSFFSYNTRTGNIGLGGNNTVPKAAVHVTRTDGFAQVRIDETQVSTEVKTMFNLICATCTPAFRFNQASTSQTWFFRMLQSGAFSVDDPGTTAKEAEIRSGGDMIIGGTLTHGSSKEIKHNIELVDPNVVLDKLATLDIARWTYNHNSDDVVHMGPMAEDFYQAFKLGGTNKGISSVDTTGVALAAIQALNEKLTEKDAQIAELEQRLAAVETDRARVVALEIVVESLILQQQNIITVSSMTR